MRSFPFRLFLVVLVPAMGALAERAAAQEATTYRFHEDSEMTIYGSANVTDWTLDVTEIEGDVVVEEIADEESLRFDRLRMRIPVEGITAGRSGQESDAHDALRKDLYPVIYFTAHDTEVVDVTPADGTFQVRTEARLTVAGEAQEVVVEGEGERLDDGRIRVRGSKDLQMTDFGIDPPTAFLGILRTRDDVRVEFDVVLVPDG